MFFLFLFFTNFFFTLADWYHGTTTSHINDICHVRAAPTANYSSRCTSSRIMFGYHQRGTTTATLICTSQHQHAFQREGETQGSQEREGVAQGNQQWRRQAQTTPLVSVFSFFRVYWYKLLHLGTINVFEVGWPREDGDEENDASWAIIMYFLFSFFIYFKTNYYI